MKPIQIIRTSNGCLTLGNYCIAWRKVLAAPAGSTFPRSLKGWWPEERETILRQFSYAVHDRINKHLPWYRKGRKWEWEWQTETERAARQINHPRLIIHWLPPWLKERYKHRLREGGDD